MITTKVWLLWNKLTLHWNKININWEDLYVLIDVAGSGTGGLLVDDRDVWQSVDRQLKDQGLTQEKRQKFLKIVIEVNGLQKEIKKPIVEIKKSITVEHIKNTIAQVAPDVRIRAVNIKNSNG
jgi:hypothetical protein